MHILFLSVLREAVCALTQVSGKCRQVLEEEEYANLEHPYDVLNLSMDVEAEFPNSNLHNFRGRVRIKRHDKDIGRVVPITMNQMLLRGCMLKNSQFVLGQVVYTGSETRIQMNSAAAPLKNGSFDHFLNMQVAILILAQVLLCILCAILNFVWRETEVRSLQPSQECQIQPRMCTACLRLMIGDLHYSYSSHQSMYSSNQFFFVVPCGPFAGIAGTHALLRV